MVESSLFNMQAFQPYNGGEGVLLSVTNAVSSKAAVPGATPGATWLDASSKLRLLISGDDLVNVCVKWGAETGLAATLGCVRIRAGTDVLLSPETPLPTGGLWIAAICPSGVSASVQITAGQGT